MPQYEVIFENGAHSVANYENDEEAVAANQAHHERALKGEPALESAPEVGITASRVVRILAYDSPPGDLLAGQSLPEDQVKAEFEDALAASTEDGVVHLPSLAARIRDLSNPFVDSGPHESNYKAEEARELDLPWS